MGYGRFAAMIATSTVVMFGLMYLNTYALDHVFYSQTRTWMAVVMGAVMALIMIGLLVTTGLINTYAFRAVPWLELASGVMHVILFFIFAGVIGALGQKNPAEFALLDSTSSSGWTSTYVAFSIGTLVPAWGFIGMVLVFCQWALELIDACRF